MRRATLATAGVVALWLAVLVPALGAGRGPGQTPSQVSIGGTVVNGTAGASLPGGLSVTATEVDAGATKQVATKTAAVRPGGAFKMDGFPGQTGDRYVVGTDYLGVTYSSEATAGTATTLKVYETTTDSSVLSVPSSTLTVIIGKQGNYNVLQLFTVHNGADRSYIGTATPGATGGPATLELPIPAGATAFSAVQGLANGLTAAPDGLVASIDPVQPGNTDVSYLYNIAVPRSGWGMNLPVVYSTAKVEVLVDPGLTLTGPGLRFRQSVTIGKQRYKDYQASGLAPGTSLTADIAPTGSTSPTLYLGLGALVVLVVATAFGLPRLRRRRKRPAREAAPTDVVAASAAGAPVEAPGSRQELIDEIAALDEAHAAGSLGEDEYAAQRAALKQRLVALTTAFSSHGSAPSGAPRFGPGSSGASPDP
ncbi:MAG TPA: hypothetical protein VET24_06515 [Actinomycetota bacterium]|nr:hypothetical protein [Actinomycetota bacterium]